MMMKIFEHTLNGRIYKVIVTYKLGQLRTYYRFDGENFKVTCPLLTSIFSIMEGIDKYGESLIERTLKDRSYISKDGCYILGVWTPIKDGFINVLGKQFLFIDEKNFYKQARKIFKPLLEKRLRKYEEEMNVHPPYKFSMMYKKTNYGSNSARTHTISLNTIMIHFPYDVIDSVIVHELAHHFVRDHSKRFYDVVYKYCPDYKLLDRRLKRRIFQ